MSFQQFGPWAMTISGLTQFKGVMDSTNKKVLQRSALKAKEAIVRNMRAGGGMYSRSFAPNSPTTIALKGSSSPLIDHGDLIGSIQTKMIDSNTSFAGVLKKHPSGANIAEILNFGTNRAGRGNKVVIPPRPFITEVAESPKLKKEVEELVEKTYREAIKGLFGV